MQVLIFPNEKNDVVVLYPSPEFQDRVEILAATDIPSGRPYRVINIEELPESQTGWIWAEEGEIQAKPLVVSRHDVDVERDRRMRSRIYYMDKYFDVSSSSLQRITGAAALAGFAIGQGAQPGNFFWHGGEAPFGWIADDNTVVLMDAFQVFNFGRIAATNETMHIFAARNIKELDPIPYNYTDDRYWPYIGPSK